MPLVIPPHLPHMRRTLAIAICLACSNRLALSQSITGLTAGARVRTQGDRATNDGIEHFRLAGTLLSKDSVRIVLQREAGAPTPPDTVVLFGVRRLEVFRGLRSRRQMIVTGSAIGGVTGVVAWLVTRQLAGSQKSVTYYDDDGNLRTTRSIVESARLAIPLCFIAGGLFGIVIGPEHWERVSVPSSIYPEAR